MGNLRSIIIAAVVGTCLAGAAWTDAVAGGRLPHSGSVVKLFVTKQGWDITQPWGRKYVEQQTCSGFFIEQGILTNAHCVADATFVEVQIAQAADRITAEVSAVNHQVDLALLRLPSNVEKQPQIVFGGLPEHLDSVVTVGYPIGGEEVSFTEGVVSRLGILPYAHSNIPNLLVQTDAAINAGNSGGPVFASETGLCLGVATQTHTDGNGLGYFIPSPVILQFLEDAQDGLVDGITNLGIDCQPLQNSALRESLHLSDSQSGVRVTRVATGASADGFLQRDDVILSVEGTPIHDDGKIRFNHASTIDLSFLLSSKQVGDELTLQVLRAGEPVSVTLPLRGYRSSIIPELPRYDKKPRYITMAGLVFLAVEPRYAESFGKEEFPPGIAIYKDMPIGTDNLQELVVISSVLTAPINKGYGDGIVDVPVKRVNGIEITSFDTLTDALLQKPPGPYIDIELVSGMNVRVRYDEMQNAESEIRKRYGIDQ